MDQAIGLEVIFMKFPYVVKSLGISKSPGPNGIPLNLLNTLEIQLNRILWL